MRAGRSSFRVRLAQPEDYCLARENVALEDCAPPTHFCRATWILCNTKRPMCISIPILGEKLLAEIQQTHTLRRFGPRRGWVMSADALGLFLFCMMLNLFWLIVFILIRIGLGTQQEHSIELFLAIIGIDFAIALDAIDLSRIVWLPFIGEYQRPLFTAAILLVMIAAIFVAKWETRAGAANAPVGMTRWQAVQHLFWSKWRWEAFSALLRWATVTAHTYWIMKLPKWFQI